MSGNKRRLYNFQGNVTSREAEQWWKAWNQMCYAKNENYHISGKSSKRIARMCQVTMEMERKKCSSKRTFLKWKKNIFNCGSLLAKDKMYHQRLTGSEIRVWGCGSKHCEAPKQVLFCCKLQGKDGGGAGSTLEVRCLLYMHTCTFSHKTDNAWRLWNNPCKAP